MQFAGRPLRSNSFRSGDFANTNFSSNVADLVAATDYLRANHGPSEILIGPSLDGAGGGKPSSAGELTKSE
jgi:hypothetical protein